MKAKTIITGILLAFATSCTNTIAEDVINDSETIEQTTKYINLEQGISAGLHLVNLSYVCQDLHIPEELQQAIKDNPQDIEAIIKAMQILETQLVFGDTLGECEEYLTDWVTFCRLNHITMYYTED